MSPIDVGFDTSTKDLIKNPNDGSKYIMDSLKAQCIYDFVSNSEYARVQSNCSRIEEIAQSD